jgi:hypothetical protein
MNSLVATTSGSSSRSLAGSASIAATKGGTALTRSRQRSKGSCKICGITREW